MQGTLDEERYARQIALPGFGIEGQRRLAAGSVLVVGLGGLGSSASLHLCTAGVGRIGLMDGDIVEIPNLHRQIIHPEESVGMKKVESALQELRRHNATVGLETYPRMAAEGPELDGTVARYDVVLDCTDSLQFRTATAP
ncbi:putative thiazole biosynthesis adenylyltransferase ThiF [Paratrimastix pyriformis]|uniref:Thiazole biosynthesis adenylyltransferase ThiF n=1 Tax=Paratrimastix pyriformis TaxID=342808 RepID=A0ABQ8UMN4_9EUKA|nr:putative thiazole biosynthesis adenylyltransferase ThiF [Paratrimastix pyriformis]